MFVSRCEEFRAELGRFARSMEKVLLEAALRLERSPDDAHDLVQDTFERALAKLDYFEPGSNLRQWLMRIMRNLFVDRWRKRLREFPDDSVELGELPSAEAEPPPAWREIDGEEVVATMAVLQPNHRQILELHIIDRRSYREIGSRLGIPVATVGTRLMRARNKLRGALESAATYQRAA